MFKIAGIQMNSSHDKEKNIETATRMIAAAAEKGAKIVCLQELFNTRWFPFEVSSRNFELAEDVNGHSITAVRKAAKEAGVVVVAPFAEKNGGRIYNSAAVINSNGELSGIYRKVHVPRLPLYEERHYFSPGNLGFPVMETSVARIGIQLGWDNLFPEGTRILALKGAQIIFAPTAAAILESRPTWERSISANAIANGLYIFRVNRVGKEELQEFYGNSFCVNPEGDIIDSPGGMQEGIVIIPVELKMIDRVRKEWGFLRDRRPEVYQEITNISA